MAGIYPPTFCLTNLLIVISPWANLETGLINPFIFVCSFLIKLACFYVFLMLLAAHAPARMIEVTTQGQAPCTKLFF